MNANSAQNSLEHENEAARLSCTKRRGAEGSQQGDPEALQAGDEGKARLCSHQPSLNAPVEGRNIRSSATFLQDAAQVLLTEGIGLSVFAREEAMIDSSARFVRPSRPSTNLEDPMALENTGLSRKK